MPSEPVDRGVMRDDGLDPALAGPPGSETSVYLILVGWAAGTCPCEVARMTRRARSRGWGEWEDPVAGVLRSIVF
jgi:hypothetical protein